MPALPLLRIALRHLATNRLRSALAALGVAIGVAAVLGPELLHESMGESYARTLEQLAGRAALQITSGPGGVAEELIDEVAAVPGVRAAVPSVQGMLQLPDAGGQWLFVYGLDVAAPEPALEYRFASTSVPGDDPLLFLAQKDSLALPASFLASLGLALESPLRVLAPDGVTTLVVRAELAERGPAALFGGRIGVMDVWAAQRLLALRGRVTQIDVLVDEGRDVATVEAALAGVVAGRGTVERARMRGQIFDRLLESNRYALSIGGMLALVVGLYLIFNTMVVSVAQRTRELGVLRSLGMRRRDVVRLVALEAGLLGLAGTLLAIPLAIGLAVALAGGFAQFVSTLYVPVDTPRIRLHATPLAWAFALGVGGTLVAAIAPARAAVRVQPLSILRAGARDEQDPRAFRWLALAGAAVVVVALLAWVVRLAWPAASEVLGTVATAGLLLGGSLAIPLVVRTLALGAGRAAGVLGPVGMLAGRGLARHVQRVAITAAALFASLAGAVATASIIASIVATMQFWVEDSFSTVDLSVNSGEGLFTVDPPPMAADVARGIAALPDVARAEAIRFVRVPYADAVAVLRATDAALYLPGAPKHLRLNSGDAATAFAAVARGEAVLVNESFARRFGKTTGDRLVLRSPSGEVRLPIAGEFFDFGDLSVVFLDGGLYRRHWRDETVSFVQLMLRPGSDPAATVTRLKEGWGAQHKLFVVTVADFLRDQRALLAQATAAVYPVIAIAIAIALLGIVTSLLATVVDRVREIALLRAIGATRRQITRALVVESALLGLAAGAIAAVLGTILGYFEVQLLIRELFHMSVLYALPVASVLLAVLLAPSLAALAGYLPGRRAARLPFGDALRYE